MPKKKKAAPHTISITLEALARASKFLTLLGNAKKEGSVALDISTYRIEHIDNNVKAFHEAESEVFKANEIEPDESGALKVERDDPVYEAVVAQLDEVRRRRVDIPPFPVTFQKLITSMEKFENNPISENLLVELAVLNTGTPEEVIH